MMTLTPKQIQSARLHAALIIMCAVDSGEATNDETATLEMTAAFEEERIRHNAECERHAQRMEEIENKYWDSVVMRAAEIIKRRS